MCPCSENDLVEGVHGGSYGDADLMSKRKNGDTDKTKSVKSNVVEGETHS